MLKKNLWQGTGLLLSASINHWLWQCPNQRRKIARSQARSRPMWLRTSKGVKSVLGSEKRGGDRPRRLESHTYAVTTDDRRGR